MPTTVPPHVVERLLFGLTRDGHFERYLQDGGIVADVWLAFAEDIYQPQRLLLTANDKVSTVHLGAILHDALRNYRQKLPKRPKKGEYPPITVDRVGTNVAQLNSFVAATVYFDELLHVVLPATTWWRDRELSDFADPATPKTELKDKRSALIEAIVTWLSGGRRRTPAARATPAKGRSKEDDKRPFQRYLNAVPILALIGVFEAACRDSTFCDSVPAPDARPRRSRQRGTLRPEDDPLLAWIEENALRIAEAAIEAISEPPVEGLFHKAEDLLPDDARGNVEARPYRPTLIHRIFRDRPVDLANTEGVSTVKADAASRLFGISCSAITWGIIDAGIATKHKAFVDHDSDSKDKRSRVRKTYDFTLVHKIRNFDLIHYDTASLETLANEIAKLHGKVGDKDFIAKAVGTLKLIAEQLDRGQQPDWALVEPLIELPGDDGLELVSDHGTHVAGTLAADWRKDRGPASPKGEIILQGVCPDINLYDLRVVSAESGGAGLDATEFGLVSAIEFVYYINLRAGTNGPIVHGVNMSLSIPHDVRNYGCGATPVCVASNRLADSGVVVVAAAGNRGWNEEEIGFGSFVFCSITDPGNAEKVITVGATHRSEPHTYGVSYFSSRGPTGDGRIKPDLVAPGEKIRGPLRGEADDQLSGTSMAAPFVSGAAAMLLARHRELIGNGAKVKSILCQSATDLGREKYFQGHGLVDILRALQSI